LSYYTKGWKYEYVSGTFTELMGMLEAGEIDLMSNISYSAERAQKLLYSSNPEGTERYYIYAKPDRVDLSKGDPKALEGLTIGCNPGVMQTTVGKQWLADEGITCTFKEIDSGNALGRTLKRRSRRHYHERHRFVARRLAHVLRWLQRLLLCRPQKPARSDG
ncbi:MAG: substrate-binding periplasmic protein, partial [Collinsella sp.]